MNYYILILLQQKRSQVAPVGRDFLFEAKGPGLNGSAVGQFALLGSSAQKFKVVAHHYVRRSYMSCSAGIVHETTSISSRLCRCVVISPSGG
ncbi:MAG: hypothetical protein E6K70_00550 [Planctomycetota bacterium]|nr:MAG: hypothetical protein E6K70_00550 [Planctomycetota bacterium]